MPRLSLAANKVDSAIGTFVFKTRQELSTRRTHILTGYAYVGRQHRLLHNRLSERVFQRRNQKILYCHKICPVNHTKRYQTPEYIGGNMTPEQKSSGKHYSKQYNSKIGDSKAVTNIVFNLYFKIVFVSEKRVAQSGSVNTLLKCKIQRTQFFVQKRQEHIGIESVLRHRNRTRRRKPSVKNILQQFFFK